MKTFSSPQRPFEVGIVREICRLIRLPEWEDRWEVGLMGNDRVRRLSCSIPHCWAASFWQNLSDSWLPHCWTAPLSEQILNLGDLTIERLFATFMCKNHWWAADLPHIQTLDNPFTSNNFKLRRKPSYKTTPHPDKSLNQTLASHLTSPPKCSSPRQNSTP